MIWKDKKFMEKLILLFLLISILSFADSVKGTVISVSDGDTFRVMINNKNEKIRLFGVDAPEHNQEWGKESREALSKLILGKEILLDIKDRDQFGRAVAVLFVENINVNLEMIRTGNAWYYEFFDKNNSENKKAMENAKKKKLGLWSKPNPIRPYEFKKDK